MATATGVPVSGGRGVRYVTLIQELSLPQIVPLTAAPLGASVLWPRPWILIAIDWCADDAVRETLGLCNWSLGSPARLLFEIEIEIGAWLTPSVNRSSQVVPAMGASPTEISCDIRPSRSGR